MFSSMPIMFKSGSKNFRLRLSLIYASVYIVICAFYIFISDLAAIRIADSAQHLQLIQTFKGLAFIFVTGSALFFLLYMGMGRFMKAQNIIELQRETVMASEHRALTGLLSSATLHDINNLLMVIHMHLEIIESDAQLNLEAKHSISRIYTGLDSVLQTARALLNFNREAGQELAMSELEIRPFIDQAWAMLSHFRKDKIIEFKVHEESKHIIGTLSPSRLKQALLNLLLNSIQAIEGKGTIEIIVRSTPEESLIEIHDSGSGIPENMRTRVFEPGYTTKEKSGGLGLVSTKFCIESIRGKIEAGSSHLNGACFRIRLSKHC